VGVALGKSGMESTLEFAGRLLEDAHVAAVPAEAFGTDRHIRISYAASMPDLERGLERLHRFIVQHS
jgi:aspartate aminotransferase